MAMRFIIIASSLFWLLISCNNSKSADPKAQRELLIEELKKLKSVFESGNKEKISQVFQFPLSDSVFSPYVDDSNYTAEREKNGDMITKDMFDKYFPSISNDLKFDTVFKYFNIDSLILKDTLEYELRPKNEPCYKFYNIYIHDNIVSLQVGSNTNTNYVETSATNDEEQDSDGCEYAWFWVFRFDGTRLYFVKQGFAG